ncbi:hypothetical protein BJ085DRAFT_39293 [Dimargaris cristalligena]|uniref:Uncharacterized protein n=1 Tax=Dimargaris cristalligena TaxID=215637 RepID=A0A4P9ZMW6_9FUNG|nr:hypothetical protein BJ085DRAFT_39293 [Dimargaris cristalligena]|eukprot:RKP34637.1 hypothetical protein BJ085DRAFT_39293 [Dimargaris cristalligena]
MSSDHSGPSTSGHPPNRGSFSEAESDTNPNKDPYAGYAPLGDDPTSGSDSEQDEVEANCPPANPDTLRIGAKQFPVPIEHSRQLSAANAELIQSIMRQLTLSDRAVPDWAKQIPEKEWLPTLTRDARIPAETGGGRADSSGPTISFLRPVSPPFVHQPPHKNDPESQ